MQEQEREQAEQALLTSQAVTPVAAGQSSEQDDDLDVLFLNAVAEIDTQPLVRRKRARSISLVDVAQTLVCLSLIGGGLFGIVWQTLAYPHTLVLLFATEKPATLTVALPVPIRTLVPVTLARSQTAPTTGYGHLDATRATGQLTFYNASFSSQTIQAGSVFIGADGVHLLTTATVTVPANSPPQDGIASVPAQAQIAGSQGNIAAFDLDGQVSGTLYVENLAAFTGGRNARDFQAVARHDLDRVTWTLSRELVKQLPRAFRLRPGETVLPTRCTSSATPDHAPGEEASRITVIARETCQGIAYRQEELQKQATKAFTTTRPGTGYQLVGTLHTSITTVSPLTVQISGWWTYHFTKDYEQHLAEQIQGESPPHAQALLLATGVISHVSIPHTLPPATYIDFVVLVGQEGQESR